ncbi:Fe-S cluster assembly sulfur transfer protein SufU [Rubellicoccus peritrichatus]|uniref:SUF system NifU family Fe-S cluster assembly protein n=1 Tax=Rubellicoccus peritrichatus TaxID=3080537 RepID=A0AAQ3LC46_9BACT|nr:SUF system NifU family Fe-S cluster assembly protein [Puniceicoccus sp. CR14]WOO43379.1 SUF system NifU family Fe-S cluster assembly protein [Puniceicoccus sp. CR14]
MDLSSTELHREILLDHSKSPQNKGQPAEFDLTAEHRDRETGDEVVIWLSLSGDALVEIHWEAKGSGVLNASCSLMSEHLKGQGIMSALSSIESFLGMLTNSDDIEDWEQFGDTAALSGIRHLPARVQCAALPWRVTQTLLQG